MWDFERRTWRRGTGPFKEKKTLGGKDGKWIGRKPGQIGNRFLKGEKLALQTKESGCVV